MDVVISYVVWFFFFQAEDGIRDLTVTGVQTCALPICPEVAGGWNRATQPWQSMEGEFDRWFAALNGSDRNARGLSFGRTLAPRGAFDRSEERRVGKECRSRWSPYH